MNDDIQLIQQLDQMPHGSAQAEAARSLWARFQKHSDSSLRFRALCSILQAATFSGATDFFVSLFPQLVKLKAEHPEAINTHTYVWRLKWLVGKLECFPEISLARISEAENLYENALREAGGGRRTAIYVRWLNAYNTGRLDEADSLRESFISMKRDSHSDCHACEIDNFVDEAVERGDVTRATEIAAPIFSGRMRCGSVPHSTYGTMALPTLLSGDNETAAKYHRKGYSLVRSNVGQLGIVGKHLSYLAAIGDTARGLRLLKVHCAWLGKNFNPRNHLFFLAGMNSILEMLTESGIKKRPQKLDLPPKWTASLGDGPISLSVLADYVAREAQALAAAFDRRNGNNWLSGSLKQDSEKIKKCRAPVTAKVEVL